MGTWSVSYDPDLTLSLASNGLAHFSTPDLVINDTWLWRSEGEQLIIGNESDGRLTQMIKAASSWVYDLTSYDFMYGHGEDRDRVITVSSDEVQLEDMNDQKTVVLRRIPK